MRLRLLLNILYQRLVEGKGISKSFFFVSPLTFYIENDTEKQDKTLLQYYVMSGGG
jgi:hypothetical protein